MHWHQLATINGAFCREALNTDLPFGNVLTAEAHF
jgi:hypothetical protein